MLSELMKFLVALPFTGARMRLLTFQRACFAPGIASKLRLPARHCSMQTGQDRSFPSEPRVGIGVVILRPHPSGAEVLLIQRGKSPSKGMWTFPGGSQELGETMVQCAMREALEETGMALQNNAGNVPEGGLAFSETLEVPTPFAAADIISKDDNCGRIQFHYTIVEVAALAADPAAVPQAASDAEDVQWVPVRMLRGFPDLVINAARIAEEAAQRFKI